MRYTSEQMREAWKDFDCSLEKMRSIAFGPRKILVAPSSEGAFAALASVLACHDYHIRTDDTATFACRNMRGGNAKSLHSFGIAIDVNWQTNPYRQTPDDRAVRFSDKPLQEDRAYDVSMHVADTDFTRDMVADIEAIRTKEGKTVFAWGGRWKSLKDTMHFQLDVTPAEAAVGIDPASVRSSGAVAGGGAPEPQAPHAPGTIDESGRTTSLPADEAAELANFERAQLFVREYEGDAYTNDPLDAGGPTHFGITQATLARYRARPVAAAEVEALTYNEAKDIYRKYYWSRCCCGRLSGPLALAAYNIGVHCGTGVAASYLQRALNARGASIAIDGEIGPATIRAAAECDLRSTIAELIDLYQARLRGVPNYPHFARGFERRVAALRAACMTWLNETAQPKQPPIVFTPSPAPAPKGPSMPQQSPADLNALVQQLVAALLAALAAQSGAAPGQAPTAPTSTPAPVQTTDPLSNAFVNVIRAALGQAAPDAKGGLGPVNGALGTWIGDLLNGRKSAIGIIGALATSLLGSASTTAVFPDVLKPLASMGIGQYAMPIFVALAAWGALGKFEKWTRGGPTGQATN